MSLRQFEWNSSHNFPIIVIQEETESKLKILSILIEYFGFAGLSHKFNRLF